MKKYPVAIGIIVLLNGCLHDAPKFPGALGSSIDAVKFANSTCPDLSGVYEGVGHLLRGDEDAKQFANTQFFDGVFPISVPAEWGAMRKNYRKESPVKYFIPADYATVTTIGNRSILISVHYNDALIGSYHSEFSDKKRFFCMDNKLIWGGADTSSSRSEWGKNTGNRSFAIYKDNDENLIYESNQQVHMNMLFGIPAGTAEYFAVYRFKKITRPD